VIAMLDLKHLIDCSVANSKHVTLLEQVAKLGEETGELQAAALVRLDSINKSASAQDNIEEEAVDAMINCLDILFSCGMSLGQIQDLLDRKCMKWEKKLRTAGVYL
jgi:NTP pyrophosphatase (non-canonical NTP hydrolase)